MLLVPLVRPKFATGHPRPLMRSGGIIATQVILRRTSVRRRIYAFRFSCATTTFSELTPSVMIPDSEPTVDQREAARLTKLYASMSDGELEKVAAESDQLTPEAQQALAAELAKRNLEAPPVEEQSEPVVERAEAQSAQPEPVELDPNRWVMLRRFRDLPEAMLAKGSLDSAGIESHLADENLVRLDWFISNLIGNAKLIVKPEDVHDAEAVLSQPIPEQFDYGEAEEFEQPRCPRCQSADITFESLNKPLAYGSAWLGFPLPLKSEKWICNHCGARWVEEPDPAESTEPQ